MKNKDIYATLLLLMTIVSILPIWVHGIMQVILGFSSLFGLFGLLYLASKE